MHTTCIRALLFHALAAAAVLTVPGRANCPTGSVFEYHTIRFRSEFLPRELSGFFPYSFNGSTPAPLSKYRTEQWQGTGHHSSYSFGSGTTEHSGLVYSGAWTFSPTDFTDTSTKEIHGTYSHSSGISRPYDLIGAKHGLETAPAMPDFGTVWGPVATLTVRSDGVSREIIWPEGPLNADTGWRSANLTENLSAPFSVQQALDRAEVHKAVGTERRQFWNDYAPKLPAEIQSRTQPVTFHAQRVAFQLDVTLCPGDHLFTFRYLVARIDGSAPSRFVEHDQLVRIESNTRTWPSDGTWQPYHPALAQGEECTLVSARSRAGCADLPKGGASVANGSVDIVVSLGRVDALRQAGVLRLGSDTVHAGLYTPAALSLAASPEVERRDTPTGLLRQVKAPELLVDVVTLAADAYELRLYHPSQVAPLDAGTGLYPVSGTPFTVYQISNPNSGTSTDTLRFDESAKDPTLFHYDPAARTMTMTQLGGARVETVSRSADGLTEQRLVKNAQGTVVSRTVDTFADYAFGRRLVRRDLGSAGALETITYQFSTDSAQTDSFGRTKREVTPNGQWIERSYDTQGRPTKTVHSLNLSGNTADAANRVTTVLYEMVSDLDGDGLPEDLETNREHYLGIEVSRDFELRYSRTDTADAVATKRVDSIRAVSPGAAWNAADNLVTVRHEIAVGDFRARVARELSPAGVLRRSTYARTGGFVTETTEVGAPDPSNLTVVDGTRTIRQTNASGQVTLLHVVDIASGVTLERQVATTVDDFGRPTRIDYHDGTYTVRYYACCGLESETGRDGLETTYDYDGLGRLVGTEHAGIATTLTLDAQGRVLTRTRHAPDGSSIVVQTNTYDTAGRQTSSRDARGRITTTVKAPTQNLITTTYPDGGDRRELFSVDGAPLVVAGTAAILVNTVEGADTNGRFVTEYRPAVDTTTSPEWPGPVVSEWVSRYTDLAGQPSFDLFPDGSRFSRYYDQRGRLARTVDPDGVTTLYAYDARGDQTTVALDLNRNGQIDWAGSDRTTRTLNSIATRVVDGVTVPVRRSTVEVWNTDGSDTPTVVTTTETTLDGRRVWQESEGLVTRTTVVLAAAGGRTETTVAPDGTSAVRTFATGRLTHVVTRDSTGAALSTLTYDYDPHGRLRSQSVAGIGTTTYTYFDDDRIHTVTTPDPDPNRAGPGYDPQVTTYRYDAAGRPDLVTLPDGTTQHTAYYPSGRVKRTWGSRTYPVEYSYDGQGRILSLTTWQNFAADTGKAITTWTYDPASGRLLNKRDALNTGPTYEYWSSGRLRKRTWARQVDGQPLTTTYTYNEAGDLALTDYSDATPDVSLVYDRRGRLTSTTDGAGILTRSYGPADLVQTETYGNTGPLAGETIGRTIDPLLRINGLTASALAEPIQYGFDTSGRLQTVSVGATQVTYGYDATLGAVNSVTWRQQNTLRLTTAKTYDRLGRLTSTTHSTPQVPTAAAHTYLYNSANQRTRATREDQSYWDYTYDTLGQVTAATKRRGDGTARIGHSFGFLYDDIGNRKTSTLNSLESTYQADLLNRYVSRTVPTRVPVLGRAAAGATVTVNGNPATRQDDWFYAEATADNSASPQSVRIDVGGVQPAANAQNPDIAASAQRQVLVPKTPETYTHDADGNLTLDGRWVYRWDAENRLIAMETRPEVATVAPTQQQKLQFAYDSGGRRIRKQVSAWNGTTWVPTMDRRFLYDGWNLVAELDGLAANTVIQTYVWGLDLSGTLQGAGGVGGLLRCSTNTATHALATDGNGNIVASLDLATGQTTHESDYGPFGEPIPLTGTSPSPYGFSSKYRDLEPDLLYYGFRYYSLSNGRWPSRDPSGESGGVNLYGIVNNDPISFVDPLGLALYAFDGTNNDGYRDKPRGNETNVFILFEIYKGNATYLPGVGTNDGFLNLLGLAFGYGGQARVRLMLERAGEYITKGDRIADIIGFSRGAAQARDFANKLKEKYPCVNIRWMGLFDTVASEGLPNDVNIGYKLGIPNGVGSVLHLTAGGERRRNTFALSSINPGPGLANPNPNYREEEVADAVHSDVGGFYGKNRGLANQSLIRMWWDGLNHDVPFGQIPSMYLNITPNGPNDSRWFNDKVVEAITGSQRVRKVYYHR
jgi:RHS repeat-associated protein